jgi:hypothetical protein
VTAPRSRPATSQPQDHRQAAAETRWAAIRERVSAEVATWPLLGPQQRERLARLLDLGGHNDPR